MSAASNEIHPVRTGLSDAALLSVAIIWGVNIPIMKTGMESSDPFWFNGMRMVVSAIVLGAFALREFRRGIRPAPGLAIRELLIYAVIISILYQFLFLLGIAQTTSGNTALIISTIPMWTAIGARIVLNERLRRLAWVGLITAFTGTLLVTFQGGEIDISQTSLVGNLCVLAAAFGWTAGTIYSRPLLRKISPMQLSAVSAAVGAPFHFLYALPTIVELPSYTFSGSVWMALLYSGIFSTGLALPLWNFGVQHAGAAHAAVIQNLVPVVAIAGAWLMRGEPVTVPQWAGGLLIIGGLLVMRFGRSAVPTPLQPFRKPRCDASV